MIKFSVLDYFPRATLTSSVLYWYFKCCENNGAPLSLKSLEIYNIFGVLKLALM